MGLELRKFVLGRDEGVWVDIQNRANQEDPEHVPETAEEFSKWEKAPWFNPDGRFIAERDGLPVGLVLAHIDKRREEKLGFLVGPDVVPEARRQGVGTVLANRALASLRSRGMERAQAAIADWSRAGLEFIKTFGFRQVRLFSTMEAGLDPLLEGVGENRDVRISLIGLDDDDARLLTRLENESFKEHFNHRDGTLEETMFWFKNMTDLDIWAEVCIAYVGEEPAGYLVYGIDHKDIRHLGKKRGVLFSIGVLKPHRGKGIAKAVMLHGMRVLKDKGMTSAGLGVDDSNVTNAFRLYESLGFKVTRKHHTFERQL